MKLLNAMMITTLVTAVSLSAVAEMGHDVAKATETAPSQMPAASGHMPMMGGQPGEMKGQGNMPMMAGGMEGMPMMKMMQERHAVMQAHMVKMETHMANVEALLTQLVELQKK